MLDDKGIREKKLKIFGYFIYTNILISVWGRNIPLFLISAFLISVTSSMVKLVFITTFFHCLFHLLFNNHLNWLWFFTWWNDPNIYSWRVWAIGFFSFALTLVTGHGRCPQESPLFQTYSSLLQLHNSRHIFSW